MGLQLAFNEISFISYKGHSVCITWASLIKTRKKVKAEGKYLSVFLYISYYQYVPKCDASLVPQ